MKIKKSFTLSEIMIAMVVLGIIVAACVPIILNMSPNKNSIMIKKAYYTIEQIVSELINNDMYYPDDEKHSGFANTDKVDIKVGNEDIEAVGVHKFNCLFASKLNSSNEMASLDSICNSAYNKEKDYLLSTQDGLVWHFGNCPLNLYDWTDGCRIDVSTTKDVNNPKFRYDSPEQYCITNGNGWGNDSCANVNIRNRAKTIAKFAVFISNDGTISLRGTGDNNFPNGQPNVANIINGTINLLGK